MLEDQGQIQQNYSEITLRLLTVFTGRNVSLLGTVLHRELQPSILYVTRGDSTWL
jgi:hypothetical protein